MGRRQRGSSTSASWWSRRSRLAARRPSGPPDERADRSPCSGGGLQVGWGSKPSTSSALQEEPRVRDRPDDHDHEPVTEAGPVALPRVRRPGQRHGRPLRRRPTPTTRRSGPTRPASASRWAKDFDQTLDWSDAPFAKWFVGGELNVGLQLRRPARRGRQRRPRRHPLRGRGRRHPHHHLRRAADGRVPGPPTRSSRPRRRQGRPRRDLPADDPRGRRRDARLRPHRRPALGRLRRLLRRRAAHPHRRRRGQGRHHRRRPVPTRQGRSAQAGRRRRPRPRRHAPSRRSSSSGAPRTRSSGTRTATSGGTTSSRRPSDQHEAVSPSTPSTRSSSSTRPAPRGSPRASSTRRAAT